MLDTNIVLVTELNKIGLPVVLEKFIATTTVFPCISYIETGNRDTLTGDTIEYSEIITTIKVWDTSMKVLIDNSKLIDITMKNLGYKRDFGAPLFSGGMGQYILRYKGLGLQTK